MANRQISQLTAGTIGTADLVVFQDALGAAEAKSATVQSIIDLVPAGGSNAGAITTGSVGGTQGITGSLSISGSLLVNGSSITGGGGGSLVGVITTGSVGITQSITGSLIATGSLTVTGPIIMGTSPAFNNPYRLGTFAANINKLYPIPGNYKSTNWNNLVYYSGINYTFAQAQFPILNPYFGGGGSNSSGGDSISYVVGHLGLGNYTEDINTGESNLEALFLHTTQTAGPNAGTATIAKGVVRTIVSDNNTIGTSGTLNTIVSNVYTANGRAHVLSVTGSMLARDGVSLGTNLSNSHIVTGSVNITGSLTVNGTSITGGGGGVQTVKVSLTSADILALNTTPFTLIPAQGAGTLINVIRAWYKYNFVTTAYTGGGSITVTYDSNGSIPAITAFSNLLGQTSDSIGRPSTSFTLLTLSNSSLVNVPITLICSAAQTLGDSTLDVYLTYDVITL